MKTRVRERLQGSRPSGTLEELRYSGLTAGETAELRSHLPADPVPAAVLVPLVEREGGLTVLLTQRASHLKNHAGQISFPGGRVEPSDSGAIGAALRETHEEIGLESRFIEIVGYLPDHVIVSGYRVTPVVGFVQPGFELRLDRSEVVEAFEVPLSFILDPANHRPRVRTFGSRSIRFLDIPFEGHEIWGATAGMLITLHRILTEPDGAPRR